ASPSSPPSGSPLASFDPCSVLSTAEVSKHGAVEQGAPERKTVGGARVCSWPGDAGDSAALVPTTSVTVRENGGVQHMNDRGGGVQHMEEDGRQYGRSPGPNLCTIAIGVTDTSRVDIQVSGVDEQKGCEIANALADVAEPKVPKG